MTDDFKLLHNTICIFVNILCFRLSSIESLGPKFIVYKECLVELFKKCSKCGFSCDVTWHVIGTCVSVDQQCQECKFQYTWASQPVVSGMRAGNLNLAAATYFSGMSFAKLERVFAAMRLACISSSTFYLYAQHFLQPTIMSLWNDNQKSLLDSLMQRAGQIIIAGDMRADSPGHCAKYGAYTMMELQSNQIALVQVYTNVNL